MVASKKADLHKVKGKHAVTEKKASAKHHAAAQPTSAVTLDRRESHDRRTTDRRTHSIPVAVDRRMGQRRIKVNRRRQIDPTTCERDYTPDEIEFMGAMDEYKRRSGRMFPTCSEVLEVIKSLGYEKLAKSEATVLPSLDLQVAVASSPTFAG